MTDQQTARPSEFDDLVPDLQRLMLGSAGSGEEAARWSFDVVGLFEGRVRRVVSNVREVLRKEGLT